MKQLTKGLEYGYDLAKLTANLLPEDFSNGAIVGEKVEQVADDLTFDPLDPERNLATIAGVGVSKEEYDRLNLLEARSLSDVAYCFGGLAGSVSVVAQQAVSQVVSRAIINYLGGRLPVSRMGNPNSLAYKVGEFGAEVERALRPNHE